MNRKFTTFLVCFLAATFSLHARSSYALVRGSILDPQHRPIPEAHIKVVTAATGAVREVVSDPNGLYEIDGLEPGTCTITVDRGGFKQGVQALNLEVGQEMTLDLHQRRKACGRLKT
jgi:hypothetical protein